MDYQRACGCRMGRSYAQPVYRTLQMNNAHLKECDHREEPTPYCSDKNASMNDGMRMGSQRMTDRSDCCGDQSQNYPSLAIVTSPSHVWQNLFSPCDAMSHGTLFCELHKPWVGCRMGGRMR